MHYASSDFLKTGHRALQLGLQMPLLAFLSLWVRYAGRPAPERAAGLALSLSFASLFAFIYLLNKTTDMVEDGENFSLDPVFLRSAGGLRQAAWFCLAAPVPWIVLKQEWAVLAVYAFVGFWGYAYSCAIPFLGLKRRLKNTFFLKTFITSGLGWAPVVIYAPMAFDGSLAPGHFLAYVRVALLFFAISACWDIRDVRGDAAAGVRTLPVVLGLTRTKTICLLLMLAYVVSTPAAHATAGRQAAVIATAVWIAFAGARRGQGYYHWGIGFWIAALLWQLGRAAR